MIRLAPRPLLAPNNFVKAPLTLRYSLSRRASDARLE
jgi:hypothetical protein